MADRSEDYTEMHGDEGKKGYNYVGYYTGTDSRSPEGKWKVLLQSKGKYWISSVHRTKYKKSDGFTPGEEFPAYRLLLDTIEPLEK
jgi:hypothetical protein